VGEKATELSAYLYNYDVKWLHKPPEDNFSLCRKRRNRKLDHVKWKIHRNTLPGPPKIKVL